MNSRFSRIKRGNRLKEEKEGHAQTHERGGEYHRYGGARASDSHGGSCKTHRRAFAVSHARGSSAVFRREKS